MNDFPEPVLLDLQGLKCPLPVLRTAKALDKCAAGAVLRVVCTDPMSAVDIPHLVRERGDDLEDQDCEGGVYVYVIRKR
jgi:tRNA 2-thiouridine synthesizing protein A